MNTATELDDGFSVEDHYNRKIIVHHQALLSHINAINEKFNINMVLDIQIQDNTIMMYGQTERPVKLYSWFKDGSYAVSTNTIEMHCVAFPFYPYQLDKGKLTLYIDTSFNIVSMTVKGYVTIQGIKSYFILSFDKNFELLEVASQTLGVSVNTKYSFIKKGQQLCSLQEESEFFKYYLFSRTDTIKLLPECCQPSAYDFNSVDFKDRLKLFDMIIC